MGKHLSENDTRSICYAVTEDLWHSIAAKLNHHHHHQWLKPHGKCEACPLHASLVSAK
ncbi:hypothetical protein CEXT_768591, partial [Caerostris extrusa]